MAKITRVNARTDDNVRAKRIAKFQTHIDLLGPKVYECVIEFGLAHDKFHMEYRTGAGWELMDGTAHRGFYRSAGEAMNCAWELSPWSLAPNA